MKVGIFDSGIGGLTVTKSIIDASLFEEIIYFGDTARVPYGVKNEETIIKYGLQAVSFFERKNVDLLICACNSVSAWALDAMQEKASFDVLGVIEPGILAIEQNADKKDNILIIGTPATTKSKKYEVKLNELGYKNVLSLATPLFVPIVEEGLTNSKISKESINHYFKGIENIDYIILACTHFPFLAKEIEEYFHNKKSVHSGDAIVDYLKQNKKISKHNLKKVSIFASDDEEAVKKIAKKWINKLNSNEIEFN